MPPPHLARSPKPLLRIALREWDRIVIGLCFIAYGIDDLATPDKVPVGFGLSIIRPVEFIVAGAAYIVGVLLKSWALRGVATVLYAMGLLTIAVIVYIGPGSPTLWLILAFGLQGFADLRRLRSKNDREAARDERDATRREVVHARRLREGDA